MRLAVVVLLFVAALVTGCGRYGYDLLSRGDDVGGGANGEGDGGPGGDGDGDGTPGDGDTGDGDSDGGSTPAGDGDSSGDGDGVGDGGEPFPSYDDAGMPGPNPELVACPAPVNPNAALPVNRYEFARTDSLAHDSVSLRHGSLINATQASGLAELNGSNGYVQLPAGLLSGLTNATIMVWLRWDSGPQNQTILDFGQSSTNRLQLLASAPAQGITLNLVTGSSAVALSTVQYLTIGTIHLLTIELDATRGVTMLYLDGLPLVSMAGSFALSDLRDDNVWIGRSNGSEGYFRGAIEELRIYDRLLGQCANLAAYRAGAATATFARCANPESACTFASTTSDLLWICDEALDFATAASRCSAAGMKLASADSAVKNDVLASAANQQITWIGLNDLQVEGTFAWCDGTTPSHQPWGTSEPNDNGGVEDCTSLNQPDGHWNDLRCSELHSFACEP